MAQEGLRGVQRPRPRGRKCPEADTHCPTSSQECSRQTPGPDKHPDMQRSPSDTCLQATVHQTVRPQLFTPVCPPQSHGRPQGDMLHSLGAAPPLISLSIHLSLSLPSSQSSRGTLLGTQQTPQNSSCPPSLHSTPALQGHLLGPHLAPSHPPSHSSPPPPAELVIPQPLH